MRQRSLFLTAPFLTGLCLLIVAITLFATRPWSPWSPWKMNQLFSPALRVENFQHMERIFPARALHKSTQPFVFATQPKPLPEHYVFAGQSQLTQIFLQKTNTTGLLVLENGVITHEEYRLGASAHSTLTSWSMAKSVVATLIGIALKEGKISSLDDRVDKYIPELKGRAYGEVTIKDLLRMASGIKFDETYADKTSDINLLFYKVFMLGIPIDDAVKNLPAENKAGTRFHYKSVDSQVLAWVLRRATGRSVVSYAQEKLWQPLGMQDEAFWNMDRQDGNELAYCCLNTTLHDYAKLGQLYLQQGQWRGEQLLPADWVKESTQRPEPWLAAGNGYAERGYGYHWWTPKNPDREYFANGVWGQTIFVDEKRRIVIVKTSADPNFKAHTAEMIAFMRGIATAASAH